MKNKIQPIDESFSSLFKLQTVATEIMEVVAKGLTEMDSLSLEPMEARSYETRGGNYFVDFDLAYDGEDYAGGSYTVGVEGDRLAVVNDAVRDQNGEHGIIVGYLKVNEKNEIGFEAHEANYNWLIEG